MNIAKRISVLYAQRQSLRKLRIIPIVMILCICFQWSVYAKVSNPKTGDYQVYQQVENIRTGSIKLEPDSEQLAKQLSLFVGNLIKATYTWQPKKSLFEEGITYPQAFHDNSLYFDIGSGLRQKWLTTRTAKYQKAGFSFERFLKESYISNVELSQKPTVHQLSEDQWEAKVRAVHYVVKVGEKDKSAFKEPLTFTFVLKRTPLPQIYDWGFEESRLEKVLKKVQLDGWKIIDYKDLGKVS